MDKTKWFNKFGKLIIIFFALVTVLSIFLPVIALPNNKAELVTHLGKDLIFGKELGVILFNGVYYAKALINPSTLLFIGFFLPIIVTLILSLIFKNRRVVGFGSAISFVISIVLVLMVNEIGSCYLSNTNLLTGLNELVRKFKDIDGVVQIGAYVAAGSSVLGLLTSIVYTFADYLDYYKR